MKVCKAGRVPAWACRAWPRLAVISCLALAAWLAPSRAFAEEARVLTLAEALRKAGAGNPGLAAQAADTEAVTARAEREALPPAWILGADLENVAGSGEMRGVDSAEATLQVSRLLELGGKRAHRRALGDAEIAQSHQAGISAAADLRALVAQRFVEAAADQQRLALAEERVALAERTLAEVDRVVTLARNPETDLRAAEIALADAELEREHAEHELRAAQVSLSALWGARQPDFERVAMPLEALAEPEAFEQLAARLPGNPELNSLLADADAAQARERLAASQARPDLTLSLGVRRLEAFNDQGLVAGISMPLGSPARARLARAESRAQATAISRRREAAEADLYQQLFERYQERGHALVEFRALSDSMIPKAQQALALSTRGFDLGRFPFTALAQSQETLFNLRRRRLDAAARYHFLSAELQRLAAAPEVP